MNTVETTTRPWKKAPAGAAAPATLSQHHRLNEYRARNTRTGAARSHLMLLIRNNKFK